VERLCRCSPADLSGSSKEGGAYRRRRRKLVLLALVAPDTTLELSNPVVGDQLCIEIPIVATDGYRRDHYSIPSARPVSP
jgi:hypothetical protein